MIARPKISRNEWKTIEIGAFEVGNFALFSCPGRETAKLQRELGADLDVDVAFQWLKFFLEDDGELASIEAQYGSGSGDYWNTAAVKKRLVVELQGLVKDHQAKRNVLSDADVASWMAVRELAPAL
jgi:tryptophanyl-tRNA synthetase